MEKKNDFDINEASGANSDNSNIVGVAQKVPLFFANSKNVITGFTNLDSNICLALSAIIANHFINEPKKKLSQKMMKQAAKQLSMKKYGKTFNNTFEKCKHFFRFFHFFF